jgi:cytochrome c oxidase subunit 2
MIEKSGDPDFVYELSCDQMCGKGHYGMRGVVIVESQEEYDRWIISQKSQYSAAHAETAPQKSQPADTTKVAAVNLKN